MEVIVHVGYPKTATTWLQENYFPNILNFFFFNKKDTDLLFSKNDSLLFDSKIVLQNETNKNLLFSSENFISEFGFGWNFGNNFICNSDKIKKVFPQAKIVLFLRRQQSIICSAYQQYIKNGGNYSINKFIYNPRTFSFNHLLYDKVIGYYEDLFGKENVFIYLFEDFQDNTKEFLERFNNDFGLVVDFKSISFKVVNRGLRKGIILLLKFFNLFSTRLIGKKHVVIPIRGINRIVDYIYKMFNSFSIFGNYLSDEEVLDNDIVKDFKARYSGSNNKLIERFDKNTLLKYGYYL